MMEKNDFLLKIGQNIKRERLKLGISQVQLADLCERDKQSIERIENGKLNTSIFMLYTISNALGIEPGNLFDME